MCISVVLFSGEFWHVVASLALAMVFGAIIGIERELSGKAAGLRTNILICMGAALFTVLSMMIAKETGSEPTRIISQIVSGVGFLGAGAIIRDRGGIQGLTTAAGIWLVASVGVACGSGHYVIAAIATVFAALSLLVFHPVSKYFRKRSKYVDYDQD
ncbi:MAG: MgtC/SapB family protein [Sedimentisphaeraceae bacterium JB056]